jgi:hypothetical protein
MPGTYSLISRSAGSLLTAAIYNEDHAVHLTFNTPGGCDDYSTNVAQMQSAVDPGEVGTESLPTDLAGEIQRLRQLIKEITGKTYWYESPAGVLIPVTLIDAAGDLIIGSAADTVARLAIGTARQQLNVNAGATAPAWASSPHSLMTGTGDLLISSGANTPARLALGTAGQVLKVNAGATAPEWANFPITQGLHTATTSGTSFNFGSLPAGTKRIHVHFRGVSLSGSDHILVQIGDAGGIETSGYISTSTATDGGDGGSVSSTAAFIIRGGLGANTITGIMTLDLMDAASFLWVESHVVKQSATAAIFGGGDKALSAELTQVTITRDGTNTFDGGSINISHT